MPEIDPGSLDRLHDIVVPPPVPWWPPSPGWYVVAAIATVCVVAFGMGVLATYRRNRYRREALRELSRIPPDGNAVPVLAELLKRVALVAFPRERVASLSGDVWLRFLNATGRTEDFTRLPASTFGTAQYRPVPELSAEMIPQLITAVRGWIQKHRC